MHPRPSFVAYGSLCWELCGNVSVLYTTMYIPRIWQALFIVLVTSQLALGDDNSLYLSPSKHGGSMLTKQKEPLNVIISATSDSSVLDKEGFLQFANATGFELDENAGKSKNNGAQSANLGDGRGVVDQDGLMRAKPALAEVLDGGNHFRFWMQTGDKTKTNAIFIAASVEKSIKQNHDIVKNGYDMGRDQLVKNATQQDRSANGKTFRTKLLKMDSSLLNDISKNDLNHNIGTDGRVAILEVKVSDDTKSGSGKSGQNYGVSVHTRLSIFKALAVGAFVGLVIFL